MAELVFPDDISNLPSMHGFVKFPDGFPAARIELSWKDYKARAPGFVRVTDMRAADYVPTPEEAAEMLMRAGEESGPDRQPQRSEKPVDAERTDAEQEAERLREEIERSVERTVEEAERVLREQRKEEESAGPPTRDHDPHSAFKFSKSGEKDRREKQQFALKDVEERSARAQNRTDQQRDKDARDAGQESEVQRENIHGFGAEDKRRAEPSIDDDQEPER